LGSLRAHAYGSNTFDDGFQRDVMIGVRAGNMTIARVVAVESGAPFSQHIRN
jgi:hypothetical protein